MVTQINENGCPVCHTALPESTDGTAAEAHISMCIESQLSDSVAVESLTSMEPESLEDNTCPICSTSFTSKDFDGTEAARESHVAACIDSRASGSNGSPVNDPHPPMYQPPPRADLEKMLLKSGKAKSEGKVSEKMSKEASQDNADKSSSAAASSTLTKQPVKGSASPSCKSRLQAVP